MKNFEFQISQGHECVYKAVCDYLSWKVFWNGDPSWFSFPKDTHSGDFGSWVTGKLLQHPGLYVGFCGSELWDSCLSSKCFNPWIITPNFRGSILATFKMWLLLLFQTFPPITISILFTYNMEKRNQTGFPGFLLLGLADDPELQPVLISMFLSMYLVTILGNLLIILISRSDSNLHTPMYLFLSNLSLNDICLSTSTIPKMLVDIQQNSQTITYRGCLTQMSFVLIFGGMENCLLEVMASDRYIAICQPLRYTVIMEPWFCVLLILLSLLISVVDSLMHSLMVLRLSFCTHLEIPTFFSELPQILKLACSDTLIDNILIYLSSCIFVGVPLSGIIFSYVYIMSSVLRMSSSEGKYKVISTCGSHLLVVSLFYVTGFGVYIASATVNSSRKTAMASVMYS